VFFFELSLDKRCLFIVKRYLFVVVWRICKGKNRFTTIIDSYTTNNASSYGLFI